MPQTVPSREHGVRRFDPQVWVISRRSLRHVGQVRDDQVERCRHRREKIAPLDEDASGEAVSPHVRAREQNRGRVGIRRPGLDIGVGARDGDRDRPASSADICDAAVTPPGQAAKRLGDESLACRTWRHDMALVPQEHEPVEHDLLHALRGSNRQRSAPGRGSVTT